MMNTVQDTTKKVFHVQDLVVWHSHTEKGALPIPGVVVRKEEQHVIIRVRIAGSIQEIAVSVDELVER